MSDQRDTILIVDDDPEVRRLLREQVFSAATFDVIEAQDGPEALARFQQRPPDLVMVDLGLSGLSGLDMLVALKSQGFTGPLLVMAERTERQSAVEAFRLGATDYITKPVREAEVLAAIERGLVQVRVRRQRDALTARLEAANRQLEARVRQMVTLYEMGETVTELRDLEDLFEQVLDGALTVTGADHALLMLRDAEGEHLVLRAGKNLPLVLADQLGGPVHNQLAESVMASPDPAAIAGDELRRYELPRELHAVAYVPLTVKGTATGVLGVGNHETQATFGDDHTQPLAILADYAAVAIVNARLFTILEERTQKVREAAELLRTRDAERGRQMVTVLAKLQEPLVAVERELIRLARGKAGRPSRKMRKRLVLLSRQVHVLNAQIAKMRRAHPAQPRKKPK